MPISTPVKQPAVGTPPHARERPSNLPRPSGDPSLASIRQAGLAVRKACATWSLPSTIAPAFRAMESWLRQRCLRPSTILSTKSSGSLTSRFRPREKAAFFMARLTASRVEATQTPRPGARAAGSGKTWPSASATNRISPASGWTCPVATQRRTRPAPSRRSLLSIGGSFRLFFDCLDGGCLHPTHGDAGGHNQGIGLFDAHAHAFQ